MLLLQAKYRIMQQGVKGADGEWQTSELHILVVFFLLSFLTTTAFIANFSPFDIAQLTRTNTASAVTSPVLGARLSRVWKRQILPAAARAPCFVGTPGQARLATRVFLACFSPGVPAERFTVSKKEKKKGHHSFKASSAAGEGREEGPRHLLGTLIDPRENNMNENNLANRDGGVRDGRLDLLAFYPFLPFFFVMWG
jgi:hypothetical protein